MLTVCLFPAGPLVLVFPSKKTEQHFRASLWQLEVFFSPHITHPLSLVSIRTVCKLCKSFARMRKAYDGETAYIWLHDICSTCPVELDFDRQLDTNREIDANVQIYRYSSVDTDRWICTHSPMCTCVRSCVFCSRFSSPLLWGVCAILVGRQCYRQLYDWRYQQKIHRKVPIPTIGMRMHVYY